MWVQAGDQVIITLTGRQVGMEIMAGMDKSVGAYGQAESQDDLELMAVSVGVMAAGDGYCGEAGTHQEEVHTDMAVDNSGSAVAGSYVDQMLAGMQGEWLAAGDVKLVLHWGGVAGSGVLEMSISAYMVRGDGSLRYLDTQRGVKLLDDKYMSLLDEDGSIPMWMAEFLAVDVAREQALLYDLIPGMVAKLGEFFIEEESRSVAGNVARGAAVCTASVQEFSGS